MRRNDVYFKPGDKVMRVDPAGHAGTYSGPNRPSSSPQMGIVYCVEGVYEGPSFNAVMLVGFGGWRYDPDDNPVGWRATYFRKVEEIKLCVEAVKAKPVQMPVLVQQPEPLPSL